MKTAIWILFGCSLIPAQEQPRTGRTIIDRHWKPNMAVPEDIAFLQRVHVDLTGIPPTPKEVAAFQAAEPASRWEKVVDRLLGSEDYAAHWARTWMRDLVGGTVPSAGTEAAVRELRKAIAVNTPMDKVAKLVIASAGTWKPEDAGGGTVAPRELDDLIGKLGDTDIQTREAAAAALVKLGSAAVPRLRESLKSGDPEIPLRAREILERILPGLAPFYVIAESCPAGAERTLEIADRFSRVFLGTTIACARCHGHPFEAWAVEDAYRLGAFFNDVRWGWSEKGGFNVTDDFQRRPLVNPSTRESLNAVWPGSKETPAPNESSRAAFARILTERESKRFSMAVVNRIWLHLFGRGIADPPDEMRLGINRFLKELGAEFAARGFDARWLIREIANSEAYRRWDPKRAGPRKAAMVCPRK